MTLTAPRPIATSLPATASPATGGLARVACIARFTLQEAMSRRIILAGLLLSAAFVALFALGFWFAYDKAVEVSGTGASRTLPGVAAALLTVMGLYAISFLASFLALFLSVGAISGEVDSGTILAILARPVRRVEFVLGRWLAYAALLGAYVVLMVGLLLLVAKVVAGYEVTDAPPAVGLMVLQALVLLTLSLLGSSRLPTLANGVVVFSLFGLAWLGGIIEFIGDLLRNDAMTNLGIVVSLLVPSDALWRGASFYLQAPSLRAIGNAANGGIPFLGTTPPTTAMIVWSIGYVAVALAASILAFSRRDL